MTGCVRLSNPAISFFKFAMCAVHKTSEASLYSDENFGLEIIADSFDFASSTSDSSICLKSAGSVMIGLIAFLSTGKSIHHKRAKVHSVGEQFGPYSGPQFLMSNDKSDAS